MFSLFLCSWECICRVPSDAGKYLDAVPWKSAPKCQLSLVYCRNQVWGRRRLSWSVSWSGSLNAWTSIFVCEHLAPALGVFQRLAWGYTWAVCWGMARLVPWKNACGTASASLTITMDTAILSAGGSLRITYTYLHIQSVSWSWCYRWGCQLRWLAVFHYKILFLLPLCQTFCVLGCSFPLCQSGLFCSLTRVLAPAAFCCSQGCLPGLGWRNQVCCLKSRSCLWSSLASALLRRGQRCWGGDFWKFAECQVRLARASAASSVPEPDQPNLHHVISYHSGRAGGGGVSNKLPLLCL